MDEIEVTLVFTIINFISVIILGVLVTYSHCKLQNHIDNRRVFVEQSEFPVIQCNQATSTEQLKSVTFAPNAPAYPSLPPANNPYYEIPIGEERELTEPEPKLVYSVLVKAQEDTEEEELEEVKEEEETLLPTEPVVKEDPEKDRLLAVEATLAILLEQQAKLISRLPKQGKIPKK